MIEITNDPQLDFKINNKGAPGTIYITDDPEKNNLTFVIDIKVNETTFTPGQLVPKKEAGTTTGSIFYLDLTELQLEEEEFNKIECSDDKWQFKLFNDERLICMTPKSEITLEKGKSISLEIKKMVLSEAPPFYPVQLTATVYRVKNIVMGRIPKVTEFPVIVMHPPGAGEDLSQYLQVTVSPDYIVSNDKPGYDPIYNKISLKIGLIHPMEIKADENTNFTVTFVYADDKDVYGALTTVSNALEFGFLEKDNKWTVTKESQSQRPYWILKPKLPENMILGPDSMSVQFEISKILTNFRPGLTSIIISHFGVPGYRDGAYFVLLEKVPHVSIKSLTISPNPTPLVKGTATINISWEVYDAGSLILKTPSAEQDVTFKPKYTVDITQTSPITLEAYGLQLANVGNIAIENEEAEVLPYSGIFLRHYKGQLPSSSDKGKIEGYKDSPDIIPFGRATDMPYPDLTIFTGKKGYDDPFESKVYSNEANLIFIRGLNTSAGTINSRVWLFYIDNNVVLSPEKWKSEEIKVNGIDQNYVDITASEKHQNVVGNSFFLWTPPVLTSGIDHFCLVAIVENPPLSDPAKPPLPNNIHSREELESYFINNQSVSLRKIDIIRDGETPTYQQLIPIEVGGEFYIGYRCQNMPTDGYISMHVRGPDSDNNIYHDKIPIRSPDMNIFFHVRWPLVFSTYFIINWWKGNIDKPAGATINPFLAVPGKPPQLLRASQMLL